MLTQDQIETMRALAEKTLDGPADPTAAKDLADALAYAAEIEADPTPPTSAVHRWLVALTRALRATGKERDEARMLADSHLRDLQGAQERLTTLGDVLAKARGTAKDGPNARLAYGPGTDLGITRSTAGALRRAGLVDLHSEVASRPCRAGFGRRANAFTVLTPNLWMTRRAI